jgi:WS/DGAT/MGAT family acyltransferase
MRSRLTSLDGSFLRLETPNAHMHVAWSGLFEPHPDLPRPTVEALREKVAARLDRVPRFRQRLAFPPMRLAEPSWVDDPGFAVANHVTAPGDPGAALTLARFCQLTDSALSEPLDRGHPLWQVQLVPRLEDGRAGLIFKMHHALVDGRSAVELALLLFDLTPDPGPEPPSRWTPAPPPSAARLALDAFYSNTLEPLRAARGVGRLAARPGEVGFTGTLRRAALAFEQDLLRSAPDSYLNRPIGPRRVLVRHRARMSDVVDAKRRAGATVNDVCLAAVAGALRELARLRGEPAQPLKAMVPVSVRADDQQRDLGNRITFAFVELPVATRSRAARLTHVRRETASFKQSGRAAGTGAMLGALGLLPDPVKNRAARLASSPRVFNLTVSNIPGPRYPLFMLGAELNEAYPVVPIAEQHALAIGMFSYRDDMFFGLYADPHALPEVHALPKLLEAEIVALARPRRRKRPGAAHLRVARAPATAS